MVPTIYNNLLIAATNYLNLGSDLSFLTLGILPSVKDDERVKKKRIKLGSLKNGYQVLMLQLEDFKMSQREEPCIRVV